MAEVKRLRKAKDCRHCGHPPDYYTDRSDPQVHKWHDLKCLNRKCKVRPSAVSMSQEGVLEDWNRQMRCGECKKKDDLIRILNTRLHAVDGHTAHSKKRVEEHFGQDPTPEKRR